MTALERLERKIDDLAQREPARELLTRRAAAKLLGVGHSGALDELLRSGRIRGIVIGRRLRIPRRELDRFLLDEVERVAAPECTAQRTDESIVNRRPRREPSPREIKEMVRAARAIRIPPIVR